MAEVWFLRTWWPLMKYVWAVEQTGFKQMYSCIIKLSFEFKWIKIIITLYTKAVNCDNVNEDVSVAALHYLHAKLRIGDGRGLTVIGDITMYQAFLSSSHNIMQVTTALISTVAFLNCVLFVRGTWPVYPWLVIKGWQVVSEC